MVICTRWKALLSDVKGLKDAADNFCQLDWTFFSVPHSVNKKLPVTNAAGNAAALPLFKARGLTLYTLIAGIIYAWTVSEKDATEQSWMMMRWRPMAQKKSMEQPNSLSEFWLFCETAEGGKKHIWNSCFFSTGIVLAASGKKRSSSICLSLPARKHGFYNRKGTTSSLSYHSKASPSLLRLCQMRLLPPTNRLRLLPLCG